jgi:folate-binding protein YgfZ
MNNWNYFLSEQGARAGQDGKEGAADFGQALTTAALADGFVAPISELGLIAANGEDAASFLHNQLTNDVEHLDGQQARLAGYCSPKGRLMASFLMWRNDSTIFLQLSRAIQPALQKRLQMFVLRAKVKLADAGADAATAVTLGLGGARAGAALAPWFPQLPASAYAKVENEHGTLIRVADAFAAPRYQWLTSNETAQAAWAPLTATLAKAGDDAWNLSDIHAGVPRIDAATQEQFVPQMVNFELLGGVNFKKGCYPGQEIVARSQYLGKLKRRTTLVSIADVSARAGAEVFALSDPAQPAGMVVNTAPNGAGGVDALVEMKLAAIEEAAVRLGSPDGAALAFLPMPYALDALDL